MTALTKHGAMRVVLILVAAIVIWCVTTGPMMMMAKEIKPMEIMHDVMVHILSVDLQPRDRGGLT